MADRICDRSVPGAPVYLKVERAQAIRQQRRFYYGWIIVATVALASFSQTAGTFPVLSVLLGPINQEFGWSRTTFTAATTAGTLAGGLASLLVSRVVDRLGGRWILAAGLFFLGLSYVLMAFMQTLWQFYALQVLGRMVTMGVIALILAVIIPKWFVAKRGLAVALAGLGGMIGNTITPLYVQRVIVLADWRAATLVAGVVIWAVSVIPVALFLRRQPEDLGLLPDGADPSATAKRAAGSPPPQDEHSFTLHEALRFPAFYLLAASFTLLFMAGPVIGLHLLPFLEDKGLTADQGVLVVATWSAFSAVGALLAGAIVSRLGARLTLSGAFALMGANMATLLLVGNFLQALVWGASIGILIGAIFNTLYQTTWANYFGRRSLGKINGAIWPIQMVANATGPLIAAVAYDGLGSYTVVFLLFGGLIGACAVMTSFARPPKAPVSADVHSAPARA